MGLDRRGPFGHTGVARHREPPEDSWGTQLPTACRMEECLATFICRIDAVCSKTYPRKDSPSPAVETALAFEERLVRAVHERRFFLLTVAPRYLLRAEDEIVQRFPVTRLSLEALLLQEMKTMAAAAGARWEVVLQADAAPHDSRDWRNLQLLVRRDMPAVEQTLYTADRPVLLVYPGLLARYDQIPLLEKLRDACTQQRHAPGFLVL